MLNFTIAIIVIILVCILISKKYNATIVLFCGGLILLYSAVLLGETILPEGGTGIIWLDPFKEIELLLVKNLGNVGLTIMMLFGFSSYMNLIGANDVTVQVMTKPLNKIKSKYLLIPIIFLLGNLLSLVIPSASSLAVLLMATLFPILTRIGLSPLASGAVITTAATIIPTPLGADNVLAAELFDMNLMDYVIAHAKISIPTILVMAVAHYFWQKYLDKKSTNLGKIDKSKITTLRENLPPIYYAILPILPLILVLIFNLGFDTNLGLVTITIMSLLISVIVESIRKKDVVSVFNDIKEFFKGMGTGFALVVSLLVAAGTLVEGLKALGIVDMLVKQLQSVGEAGILLTLAFSAITALIGFISGSGLAVFYAAVELIPPLAESANINGIMISLPMQMVANLIRSISPVSAVVIIVCSITGTSPLDIIKRTSVPIIIGIVLVITLSIINYA